MTLQDGITPNFYASDNGVAINPSCGANTRATSLTMPSMSATVAANAPPAPGQQGLTIQSLNQRLPSIVNSAPISMAPDAGCADPISAWAADNPMMAGLGLLALGWFFLGRK